MKMIIKGLSLIHICFEQEPELKEISPGHCVKCHFAQESRERMLRAETSSIES